MFAAVIAAVLVVAATITFDGTPPAADSAAAGATSRTVNGCPAGHAVSDAEIVESLGITPEQLRRLHVARGLSNEQICTIPPPTLARSLIKVNQASTGFANDAARFREQQQAGDNGKVRSDGLSAALQARRAATVSGKRVAGITDTSWTPLGPGNIGGRLRAVLTHPTDDKRLLVGSVSGGIWKSTDGGQTWKAVDDFMPSIAVATLVRDPSNTQRVYAGTGESFAADGIRGLGVFVSKDGGDNWVQLGGTLPNDAQPDFYYVNRIAVHPTDSRIVLLATKGGVYRSRNATDPVPVWTKVYAGMVLDIKFDPRNGDKVLLGEGRQVSEGVVLSGGAIAYSNDAGVTFGPKRVLVSSDAAKGRVEIAWAPATSGLVAAVTEDATEGTKISGTLWVSVDSGATWYATPNSVPNHLGTQGDYDNTAWFDPTDSRRLVVGGIDLYRGDGDDKWWETNKALGWTKISDWSVTGSVHADQHAIVHASNYSASNRVVYFGNDGGIYRSNDIAAHDGSNFTAQWVNLNNGLPVTQFYSGAGRKYANNTTRIVGGTQDNGSLKGTGAGLSWTEFFGGDGGYSAVDPVDANVYYGEYIYAAIHRANTGGNSKIICDGPNPIREGSKGKVDEGNCGPDMTGEANFIAPFVLDPNNPNTMLVGAKSLWRSTDVKADAPSWSIVKPLQDPAYPKNYISAIAVAPTDSKQVWVGHNYGEVYCTRNGTDAAPNWTKVSTTLAGGLAPRRMVLRITVDPDNANRVFVTYGGYEAGNVRELTDSQQVCKEMPTVTNRQGNLPSAPVRSLVRHPKNRDWLYVGTEVGTFASTDGGTVWSTTNEGPSSVSVDELFWLDGATLVAATHGRSMFQATIPAEARAPAVTTGAASVVTANTAIVGGSISSNGASTVVSVQYGPSTRYGKTQAATPSPLAADATTAPVSAALTGLACGSAYHYRAVGTNSIGTSNGTDATLMTTACGGGSAYSRAYVQKAYVAYYGRPADPAGLTYWAVKMDGQGGSLQAIIDAFGNSDEFNRRHGGLTDTQMVAKIYQQTLARDPDPAGLAWYVAELRAGRTTLQRVALDVLNGASGDDAITVANKVDVAGYYTGRAAGGCPYGGETEGVAAIGGVSSLAESVNVAKAAIDARCGP